MFPEYLIVAIHGMTSRSRLVFWDEIHNNQVTYTLQLVVHDTILSSKFTILQENDAYYSEGMLKSVIDTCTAVFGCTMIIRLARCHTKI